MSPKTSPTDNLRHWNALGRTDPSITSPFDRGRFKGTSIKPIWTTRRMTEHFGPCGVGWGMDKPEFQLVPAGEELMVYCTVRLWFSDEAQSNPYGNAVYGVGGDRVIKKFNDRKTKESYFVNDDEAFKSAYTDALGNAMKQIGVAADVHMGRFDDSKYVQEARKSFAQGPSSEADLVAITERVDRVSDAMAARAAPEPVDKQLMERASQAAQKGSYALEGLWNGLGFNQKKMLKPVLDTHLKPIAEAADRMNERNPEDGPPARSPASRPPEAATPNAASPPESANL